MTSFPTTEYAAPDAPVTGPSLGLAEACIREEQAQEGGNTAAKAPVLSDGSLFVLETQMNTDKRR